MEAVSGFLAHGLFKVLAVGGLVALLVLGFSQDVFSVRIDAVASTIEELLSGL